MLSFRWPRWPFVRTHAKQLDRVQKAMYRSILGFKQGPSDDAGSFYRRVYRTTNAYFRERGLWSVLWAKSVLAWIVHVVRNSNLSCWSTALLQLVPVNELARRRTQFQGRTQTRATPGFVNKQYLDCVVDAYEYLCEQNIPTAFVFDRAVLSDGTPADFETLMQHL